MLECPIQNTAIKVDGVWKQARPRITQLFGLNPDFYAKYGIAGHNGIDFGYPVGTPVFASHDGVVTHVKKDEEAYGWHIRIRSIYNPKETIYAHLSEIDAEVGQVVALGDKIGEVGNTGDSSGPHLHWGWRQLIEDPKLPISQWKVKDYDNGYYGWQDCYEYAVTWKGTLATTTHE